MTTLNRRDFLLGGTACGLCAGAGVAKAQPLPTRLDLSDMRICGASPYPTWNGIVETRAPHPDAVRSLEWLTRSLGVDGNFTLLEGVFSKGYTAIAAVHSRHRGRFIVYDAAKFKWTPDAPDWEEVTILGHEIGHHLNGDTNLVYPHDRAAWARELHADQTAGFLVSQLGGPLSGAQSFFRRVSREGGETHPPRDQRLAAVERGWRRSEAFKAWQGKRCETGWIGEPFEVGGETCRVVQHCAVTNEPMLACRNLLGDWTLKR